MKKILLPLVISVITITLAAQTQSGYVPFHQYFLQNRGDIQKSQGNSRDVSYAEIAYMHYTPVNDSEWIYADSGQFYFSQIIADTTPVYETGGVYFNFYNIKWDSSGLFTSTADGLGQPMVITAQNYDTTSKAWVNSYQVTNTYNAINYLANQSIQSWNGAWVDSVQYTDTYNAANFDSTRVVQSGNPYQNDTQYLYTYNGYNNTELITQVWSGSAWTNLYKQSNSFDANGNNYQSFISVWNGSGWNNYALIIRGYDLNNELVSYVSELWNASAGVYVNSYQEAYAWVLSNNTQFENYTWDTLTNSWTPLFLNTYSFDANHNVISENDQAYVSGVLTNANLYYYYYQGYMVSSVNQITNNLGASLYPNPTNAYSTVTFNADKASNLLLNVYDAQGNLINQQKTATIAGNNKIAVNLGNYATGNYFIDMVDLVSGENAVLKLVKQ